MNEELHNLLDGELSDGATVDLLRSLIDDPGGRAAFRQQMRLQGELIRNESFASMTPSEEDEMLSRVGSAIGIKPPLPVMGRLGARAVSLIAAALLLGGGLGYMTGELVKKEPPASTETGIPSSVQIAPTPVAAPCNCDSAVTAVRDSLSQAAAAAESAKKNVRPARKKSRRPAVTTGSELVPKKKR
jgi:hypothetical protein